MTEEPTAIPRRALLQSAAGLAIGALAVDAPAAPAVASPTRTPGKAGDFNFLTGNWTISHRQVKASGGKQWDEFQGEATCWSILGGIGSIEELRIPARNFSGMGLRLLDVEKHVWADFWVNARSGVLVSPGTNGSFENGIGTFIADDVDQGRPIKVRGVWDRITPTSCRWHQAISRDGGKLWEENWFMDWARV